jgi:hypothetical protein
MGEIGGTPLSSNRANPGFWAHDQPLARSYETAVQGESAAEEILGAEPWTARDASGERRRHQGH